MFGNGKFIKTVLVVLPVLVRLYSFSDFSIVLVRVLIYHQCTRTGTCTRENVLGPRSAMNKMNDQRPKASGGMTSTV